MHTNTTYIEVSGFFSCMQLEAVYSTNLPSDALQPTTLHASSVLQCTMFSLRFKAVHPNYALSSPTLWSHTLRFFTLYSTIVRPNALWIRKQLRSLSNETVSLETASVRPLPKFYLFPTA